MHDYYLLIIKQTAFTFCNLFIPFADGEAFYVSGQKNTETTISHSR